MNIFTKRFFGLVALIVFSCSHLNGYAADPALSIKGLKFYADDPFRLDFFFDCGGVKYSDDQLKAKVQKLIDYFLVALTIPEDEMGINFFPRCKYPIISPALCLTGMGQEMLSQNHALSQLANDYTDAREPLAVNNFQETWVMPDKAVVYINADKVYLGEAALQAIRGKDLLPTLAKEVNGGVDFAPLRRIYESIILAAWFKKNLKESAICELYADKKKINGFAVAGAIAEAKLYSQDLGLSGIIQRRYFSSGLILDPDPKTFPLSQAPAGTINADCVVSGKIIESGVLRRIINGIPDQVRQSIEDGVKALQIYDSRVAGAFLAMVWNFKDARGRPILLSYRETLGRARSADHGGFDKIAQAQEKVIADLVPRLQSELLGTVENGFSFLPQIMRSRRSDCVGRIQIFYILGNYLGLAPRGVEVTQYWDNHPMPDNAGHVETIFTLSNGMMMMTNTINGTVSRPFDFEKTFVKNGNYWELRDKNNPLSLDRRIRPLENGVLAPVYSNLGAAYQIQGNLARAIDNYDKAVKIDPGYAPAQRNLEVKAIINRVKTHPSETQIAGMVGEDDPVDGFTFKITRVTRLDKAR